MLDRCPVTSFCAPPTVWRMLIQADLSVLANPPSKVVGAGEPLNPEVIEQVEKAWGVRIRDGFGQTESTVQIGNPPGQLVKPGSMGRPIPGYPIELIDPATGEKAEEGEICIDLAQRPLGLMVGYHGDDDRNADAMAGGYYHTGDVGSRDADGYITYVGRADDVFKASDYRISPFELESVLIEHPAVAEAAIVPSPDPLRLAVPKAYVVLAAGHEPTRADRALHPGVRPRQPRPLQADPAPGVRAAAQDDLREDPPGGAARSRGRAARRHVEHPARGVHALTPPSQAFSLLRTSRASAEWNGARPGSIRSPAGILVSK